MPADSGTSASSSVGRPGIPPASVPCAKRKEVKCENGALHSRNRRGAGCSQEIVYREFFAPTDDVKLVREDGSTVGAVKIEATRHGVPNWSDHKTLSVSFMGL